MALTELPASTTPQITVAANRIRELAATVLDHADVALLKIRNIVRDHGRSAISAELGEDANSLALVYSALKSAVEAGKEINVDEL